MAAAGKVNKREQQVADKEAATIVKSLSRASDAAVHTTLAGINTILAGNIPLMYHINALLNDPEWTAVLESSLKSEEPIDANGDKPDHRKLRNIVKKFQHLDRLYHMLAFTCMCMFELLHHLKHVYVLLHVPIHVLQCNINMNYAFIFVFCFWLVHAFSKCHIIACSFVFCKTRAGTAVRHTTSTKRTGATATNNSKHYGPISCSLGIYETRI